MRHTSAKLVKLWEMGLATRAETPCSSSGQESRGDSRQGLQSSFLIPCEGGRPAGINTRGRSCLIGVSHDLSAPG
jgi:hypothetical protein